MRIALVSGTTRMIDGEASEICCTVTTTAERRYAGFAPIGGAEPDLDDVTRVFCGGVVRSVYERREGMPAWG